MKIKKKCDSVAFPNLMSTYYRFMYNRSASKLGNLLKLPHPQSSVYQVLAPNTVS